MSHHHCQARQQSDQMYCPKCHLLWDMKDPDPPECKNSSRNQPPVEPATTEKKRESN